MRILHIGKYYPPVAGGMERFLGDLVEAQRRAGHSVAVLAHAERGADTRGDPAWLMRCPVWLKLIFAPISPAFPFWLWRALRHNRPDVLHIHAPNPSAFWAMLLPSARRIPWVVHWHSDVVPSSHKLALRLAYPHYRVFEYALLERAEAIIATSRAYLEASLALRPWRHKCHVVPLGIDTARLGDVASSDSEAGWLGGRARILAIGRLSYYKGFETLIEAVAGMTDAELVIVGEGEERPLLERALERAGRPAWIRLAGHLDDLACQRLLATCDVFCLPSRERTEAFGIVLMEAMRYAKPLVATRIPGSGVAWVARHGENALLAQPDDAMALRQALQTLSGDAALRDRLGQAGATRYRGQFDIERIAQRIDALYASLLPEAAQPIRRALPLVVIPALDEAASIAQVVRQIKMAGIDDVVVIDDHSSDATPILARQAGAVVLRAPLPQGAWGAMQTGIRYALLHGYPGVITMDADGQHEPAYIPDLIAAGATHDIVIGAYPERGSRLRKFAWSYFRMLTGYNYADLTSGFRYYTRPACELLAEEEATLLDYQDIGVLLLLHKAGLRVREVPVAMRARHSGSSRVFSSWWTVARYMAETTLLCMARWRSGPKRA